MGISERYFEENGDTVVSNGKGLSYSLAQIVDYRPIGGAVLLYSEGCGDFTIVNNAICVGFRG